MSGVCRLVHIFFLGETDKEYREIEQRTIIRDQEISSHNNFFYSPLHQQWHGPSPCFENWRKIIPLKNVPAKLFRCRLLWIFIWRWKNCNMHSLARSHFPNEIESGKKLIVSAAITLWLLQKCFSNQNLPNFPFTQTHDREDFQFLAEVQRSIIGDWRESCSLWIFQGFP